MIAIFTRLSRPTPPWNSKLKLCHVTWRDTSGQFQDGADTGRRRSFERTRCCRNKRLYFTAKTKSVILSSLRILACIIRFLFVLIFTPKSIKFSFRLELSLPCGHMLIACFDAFIFSVQDSFWCKRAFGDLRWCEGMIRVYKKRNFSYSQSRSGSWIKHDVTFNFLIPAHIN